MTEPTTSSQRGELPEIAYLTGRYPTITHTFILREVRELRRLGMRIRSFSLWRSSQAQLLSPVDREEFAATTALVPIRPVVLLKSLVRGLRAGPLAILGMAWHAQRLASPGVRARLIALSWFVEALMLWDHCRQSGIRHIHVHLNGSAPAVALLVARLGNAVSRGAAPWSYSMTVHGSKEFYDVARENLAAKFQAARFIVCISDYTRSQVMSFLSDDEWHKLQVVRCGVDAAPEPPDRRRVAGAPLRLLTVARLDAQKGVPVLLQALARVRATGIDACLTVVGDGPLRARFEGLTGELGVASMVEWTGALGQDRLPACYAEADVFCLPSFAEGIPIVLMEAMAAGLPVVTTRITGVPELVDDGVCGLLVTPSRVDELADAIGRLARSPELRQRLGHAGREAVRSRHDVRASGRDMLALFQHHLAFSIVPERRPASQPA
jgi:colanic acid/amylovoran biosynthesis glycosyltransferase